MRRVWGLNNREAPLRLCSDAHGEPNNAEYKTLDATANPYLALAVLIIAGLEVSRCLPSASFVRTRLLRCPHRQNPVPVP